MLEGDRERPGEPRTKEEAHLFPPLWWFCFYLQAGILAFPVSVVYKMLGDTLQVHVWVPWNGVKLRESHLFSFRGASQGEL